MRVEISWSLPDHKKPTDDLVGDLATRVAHLGSLMLASHIAVILLGSLKLASHIAVILPSVRLMRFAVRSDLTDLSDQLPRELMELDSSTSVITIETFQNLRAFRIPVSWRRIVGSSIFAPRPILQRATLTSTAQARQAA